MAASGLSARMPGMGWFVWALIALVVLTVGFIAVGRAIQRKGRDIERHRE
jgi:hypothetical protein